MYIKKSDKLKIHQFTSFLLKKLHNTPTLLKPGLPQKGRALPHTGK